MMTPLNLALYLTCLFSWRIGLGTYLPVNQDSGFISANVGDNVTLQCFYASDVSVMFLWYKQTLGQKPVLISTFYKYDVVGTFSDEFRNNPRFSLETKDGKNHLTITDLCISDSATYYCVSCSSYKFEFGEGTTISVKGSGLDIQASVRQSEAETIQSGDSISCTVNTGICDREHKVYWFKNEEESHPGLMYTDGGRNNQCEGKSNTQTKTCGYNLPINSPNLSHAGTDYCAVASCGQIVLGDGTKLELADDSPEFLLSFLSGALAFTIILNVLLAFLVQKMKKRNHCQCTDTTARYSSTANTEGYQDADNLHYAALRNQRSDAPRRQREDLSTQCVYSSVKL